MPLTQLRKTSNKFRSTTWQKKASVHHGIVDNRGEHKNCTTAYCVSYSLKKKTLLSILLWFYPRMWCSERVRGKYCFLPSISKNSFCSSPWSWCRHTHCRKPTWKFHLKETRFMHMETLGLLTKQNGQCKIISETIDSTGMSGRYMCCWVCQSIILSWTKLTNYILQNLSVTVQIWWKSRPIQVGEQIQEILFFPAVI